jgi:enoyl-CoA hydratase/carnithine racemase
MIESNDVKPQKYGSTLLIARLGTSASKDQSKSKSSILLVALNRLKVKNAFNDEQYLDLVSLLKEVDKDDTIHALVLTGMGNYFSSGADLSSTNFGDDDDDDDDDNGEDGDSEVMRKGMIDRPAGKFMMAMLSFTKVICCAVNGPAVGIGVTLLPHCDLVYCTKKSTFWVPFTRIALVPEFASSVTFVEAMGMVCANEMLLLGEKIDANKAISKGLCIGLLDGCNDDCDDAFTSDSIGWKACEEIDKKLLSLPSGGKTAKVRKEKYQYTMHGIHFTFHLTSIFFFTRFYKLTPLFFM